VTLAQQREGGEPRGESGGPGGDDADEVWSRGQSLDGRRDSYIPNQAAPAQQREGESREARVEGLEATMPTRRGVVDSHWTGVKGGVWDSG
jgi:hypothetical protein